MTNSESKIFNSVRIKLSADQRQAFKDAYRALQPHQAPRTSTVMPGSTITVENAPVQSDVNRKLGMPHVVVIDLLASRDAISLPTVLLFQKVLEVEVITENELKQSFGEYLEHVYRM